MVSYKQIIIFGVGYDATYFVSEGHSLVQINYIYIYFTPFKTLVRTYIGKISNLPSKTYHSIFIFRSENVFIWCFAEYVNNRISRSNYIVTSILVSSQYTE